MRFIGGKSLMLDRIDQVIKDNSSKTISIVGDLFCGSGVVSQHFKKQGKKVISNDIMYMSYVLARGLTELNSCPTFGELQIKDILFAGILISSLGAIMDTGMSIVSALFEVYHHQPNLTRKELFNSGIEIGKDMIGTMTNTLILAFTGSAFVSLLVLFSYNVDVQQLMNSNYIAIEFAQGIAGTLGIVLTVPIASLIASTFLVKQD